MREIEDEIHARMSRLEAQLIQDTAQASKSRTWSGASPQERPTCPVCGTPLHARGKRARKLQAAGGQEVTLKREYGTCPNCGTGLFPLDEELAWQPGCLTPRQREHLAHLAIWMPFERARQMLEEFLGIQVSEPTVRRGTERTGSLCEARQTAQSQQTFQAQAATTACEKQVISTDGAYVPLVKGEWAEVRTVAIGEVKEQVGRHGQREVHTGQISYFSRMTDAESFGNLAEVEMRRRGTGQAKAVCAVTDGADWIQGFIDLHRPDALRVLDFPHAAEHLTLLLEALQQAGMKLPPNAFDRCLHILKRRGPGPLVRCYDRLPANYKELEVVQKQMQYFGKRLSLMQYPDSQRDGWPIGSGMVESANKVVVQARLKGAGMHWAPKHVNPMLALRTAVCSERWEEAWQDSVTEQQRQRQSQRKLQATARMQSQLSSMLLLLLPLRPPTPKSATPSAPPVAEPAATLPGSSRPSAHHPWKRMPACRPKDIAKI